MAETCVLIPPHPGPPPRRERPPVGAGGARRGGTPTAVRQCSPAPQSFNPVLSTNRCTDSATPSVHRFETQGAYTACAGCGVAHGQRVIRDGRRASHLGCACLAFGDLQCTRLLKSEHPIDRAAPWRLGSL